MSTDKPDRETCGNFGALKEIMGKPFRSEKAKAWTNVVQECTRICGEVREECIDAVDSRRKRTEDVADAEAI